MQKKKVFLTIYDMGEGHRSTANALRTAIELRNLPWEIEIVEVFKEIFGMTHPQYLYNNLILQQKWIGSINNALLVPLLKLEIRLRHPFWKGRLKQYWQKHQPDLVVSLMPLVNRVLCESLQEAKPGTPFVTSMTDFADCPPHFWIEPQDQFLICPSDRAVEQAERCGYQEDRLFRTSELVVNPRFYEPFSEDRAIERERLGLKPDLPTGLIMFGGRGSREMLRIADHLERSHLDIQLIYICGRNERLAERLRRRQSRFPQHVESFTDRVPYYMHLSDFFIGKPGNVSISESIAMELPVITDCNDATLLQERYCTEWIADREVGIVIPNFQQVASAVADAIAPENLSRYRTNIQSYNNQAVFAAVDILESILARSQSNLCPKTIEEDKKYAIDVVVLEGGGGHYATYQALRAIVEAQQLPWQLNVISADKVGERLAQENQTIDLYRILGTSPDEIYDWILQKGWTWLYALIIRFNKFLIRFNYEAIVKMMAADWRKQTPDLVISFVPFFNKVFWDGLRQVNPEIPLVTILTDFADCPPAYWIEPETENYLVCGTQKAVEQARSLGVEEEYIIKTSGLVVRPHFYEPLNCDRDVARKRLGLEPDCVTGLVLFGANGSSVILDIAQRLECFGQRLQLIFICGRNEEVADELRKSKGTQKRAIVGFTEEIPYYMELCDFLIGKAGNVSISEALVKKLPVIVERNFATLPQERYLTEWIEREEVGIVISSFKKIANAVESLLDSKKLTRYRANIAASDNRAVFELPDIIDRLLTKSPLQTNKSGAFQSATSLYSFTPSAIARPTTEADIVEAVREAARQKLKVRAIGSLHSQAPIPATDGVCIVLDRYKSVVKIEGSLVIVQAGMKLCELNEILAKHGLALPILGSIDRQTVSGAISTGTHGGSLYYKSLSSYVRSLRIVRSDGTVLNVNRSQHIFNAIALSMGLLGIVSEVTFECVPAFSLQAKIYSLSMDDFLQQFDEIHRRHKYVDIRYAPITDNVQISAIDPAIDSFSVNGGWYPATKSKIERKLSNFATAGLLRIFRDRRFNWLQRATMKQYEKSVYACPFGQSDFVLTHFDATNDDLDALIPVSDMEIAVPYFQAHTALACLRNHFHTKQQYPNMQIHIRCSAAEDLWLSPAYDRIVCWIEFWEYPRTGEFFEEMTNLLKPFDFRCHWGKQIAIEREYLERQYPKWHDFLRLRREWDPERMFANPCLDRYLSQ